MAQARDVELLRGQVLRYALRPLDVVESEKCIVSTWQLATCTRTVLIAIAWQRIAFNYIDNTAVAQVPPQQHGDATAPRPTSICRLSKWDTGRSKRSAPTRWRALARAQQEQHLLSALLLLSYLCSVVVVVVVVAVANSGADCT